MLPTLGIEVVRITRQHGQNDVHISGNMPVKYTFAEQGMDQRGRESGKENSEYH